METEAKVPENSSTTNFTLVESTTTNEREEIKFTQKNGNDLNSKDPLVEETRQANSGRTSEISVTGPQEIYQHSSKVSAERAKHAEHQPEGYNIEVLKHSNAEVVMMGIIPKSNVPADKALSISPNTASVQAGTVVGSIQDKIQNEAKSAVTDEQQEPEKYFSEKEEVPKAFDPHEVTGKIYAENKKKDEPQYEAQSLETKVIKNPNLGGETTEINSSNDTEEHEKVSALHVGEILNIKDGGKFIKEEAKVVEEANNMKLLKTATETLEGDDSIDSEATIPSTSAIAKGETVDEIFQKQTLKEEESATIENYESCRPESELEQAAKADEAIDPSETMCKLCGENEEHTDHQSETPTLESAITKNTVFKGFMAIESSTKPNYHVEEPEKIPDSHTTEISEIKDGGKALLEETIYIKEPMDVKLQKSETKSVPEDKVMPALLTTASYTAETVEESTQEEILMEVESAVTDTKEEQTPENDFEEKKNEAFDLQQVTAKNEKKDEPQPETQSLETIVIKHQNLEGVAIETNPSNDTEVFEMVPASHTEEKLEINEDDAFGTEKAKDIKEATNMQITESATESVLDNGAQPTLHKSTTVKGEKVDEIFQEHTLKEEESAAINNSDSCTPENQLTQAAKFVEQIGLSDTTGKVAAVNEQHADNQFESPVLESAITEHTLSEGLVTMENSNKSSYDVEELQKIPGSHFVENLENKDVGKPTQEEAIYIKEATDVELGNSDRENEASKPLHSTEAVGVGTVDGIFEEEIHMKMESVATYTKQGQRPENNFKKKEFPKAINLSAAIGNTIAETKKKDQPQHEVLNQKTTVINLVETTETNTGNDMEEIEMITPLITEQKIEINDGGKCIEEQAKDMEEAMVIQQLKTATESNEAPSTLLKSAIVKGETRDEIIQEQTLKEEEMTVIETQKRCKEENEQEQVATNVEAIDLPITMGKVNAENEEQCDHQSEAAAWQNTITKHTISEGVVRIEISTMSSHDVEEQEEIPKSHTAENSEINDSGKAPPEEPIYVKEAMEVELRNAEEESVPKDKALSSLSFTASVGGETVEESIQEEIQKEGESKVADAKDIEEGLRPENDFEENKNVLEDFEVLEATAENEKKDEPQLEVQSQQTINIRHPNLQGEATETSPSNNSEEHEKVSTSCTRDNLETKEGGKYTPEEAKEMEEETNIQLLKTATESFDDEDPSILPTLSIVKDETVEEAFCLQMLKDEEPAVADNTGSCPPENDLEQTAKVVEDVEEHADDKLQASKLENAITKHTNSEGTMTREGSTKTSNEVEEQEKIPNSHSVENLEIKGSSKILPEQTISMKEAAVESPKSETKSLPEDKLLSTLPIAAPIGVETFEERIQEEIHKEVESEVTNTKGEQTPKDNFEEIKEVPEAFEQHEAIGNMPRSVAQSLHPNLQGEATKTNPCNDSEEHERVSTSCSRDNLETKEGGKYKHEEAKGMEEETDIQLLKTATESFDDEGPSILPTLSIVKDETVEETFCLQTLKDEEPAAADNTGSCPPENDLEQTAKVVEDIEEHADDKSQALKLENATTKHTNSEGMMTSEGSTKTSNEVEEQQKIPKSHCVENLEIKESNKILPEQTISMKEAAVESPKSETKSLPEDKVLSTLPIAAPIGVETVEDRIQEEIHKLVESAVTNTKEGQTPKDNFEEIKEVPEEAIGNIPQSEVQTIVIKHQDVGDTTETNTGNDTEENEQLPASHTSEKLEIKDVKKFIEAQKEIEEAIDMQLQESSKGSDDEAPSTLPTPAMVKGKMVDKVFQEQTFRKEEPAAVDKDGSSGHENELEETATLLEAIGVPETKGKVGAENEEQGDNQSKVPSQEAMITNHTNSEGTVTMEGSTESYDVEQQKIPDSHSVQYLEIKDGVMTLPEQAIYIKEATNVGLPKSETESLPEDIAMSTLSITTSVEVDTVEESIQEELHSEVESAVTETKAGQRPESDFGEEQNFPEDLDLHKTGNTGVEAQKKYDPQHEVQSLETIAIEHPDSEADGTEINTRNDTQECEEVPASHTSEKLEIKERGKFILEEGKEKEEGIDIRLEESEKESVPDDEASSTLPTSAIVKDDTADEIIQEKTFKKEDSAVVDTNGSFRQEDELDETAKVVEAIDIPKTMGKVNEENERHMDCQSEFPILETPNTQHANSEGIVTVEGSTKASYDVDEQENIRESHSVEKSDVKDGGKTLPEEAIYIKEATYVELPKSETESVPEDKVLSTLPTTASFKIETVEEGNQEEIQKEGESAVTDTKEGQRPEIDFGVKKKVHEAFDLHEATGKTCVETEKKYEPQSEAQSLETIAAEHPDLEDAKETNPSNDTEEFVQVPVSHTAEELVVKDREKFILEESKEMELSTGMQLQESAKESVPDDEALSTLPTLEIVKADTVKEIIQEQTFEEEESATIDYDMSYRPENELQQMTTDVEVNDLPKTTGKVGRQNEEYTTKHTILEGLERIEISTKSNYDAEKMQKIPESHPVDSSQIKDGEKTKPEEDFDLCEATGEYEKKDESQLESQSMQTIVIKHPNVRGTPETQPSNDVEELEQVPVSHNTQKLEIKEGRKYIPEEAEKVEEATDRQLESVPDVEALSTLAKSEIVKCETADEQVHKQTFTEEKLVAIDNQWTCRPENALEQAAKVGKEINLPETKIKVGDENDKHGSHQSEAHTLETLVMKHTISGGLKTMEIHTKSSYNVEELEKIPESHSVENSKIKDGGITVPVEAIYINGATNLESTKSTTESILEDKVLSTLPTSTLVGVETIEESIQQEINKEAELTVTDIHEKQRTEYDFEEKKTVPKRTTAENKKKDEPQFEVQSLETLVIKHATLEGDTTDTKPSDDTEEQEQVPVSYTVKKSEIQDAGKSILEEEKEMDEANDIQLQESAKESIPDNEASSTLPTSAIVKVEMLEEMFQEQTIEEEESEAIDNGRSRPENEFERAAKVVEVMDLHETMGKVGVENAEHANHQSKTPTMETTFRRHTPSEGLVTTASSTGSSYEVDELRKLAGSHSLKNSEIKDSGETLTEERTDVESSKYETESVPEDKSQSTLPTTAPVGAETVQESIQENIHMEVKSAMTHTKEWQRPDNGLKEKKNVPEAFDQDQVTSNTSSENETKDEPQSEEQSADITTAKNPNSDTEELEMVPVSHAKAKIEINDGGKFMQEEEKEMEEATYTQLPISAKQSVANDEAPSTLSTLAIVKVESEIVEEISQEQTLEEEESAATDNNGSCRPKNKLEQMETVVKEIDLPETMGKVNAENEKHNHHQSEAPTLEIVITKYRNSEGIVTMDSSTKSNFEVKQQEKNPEAHSADNLKNKDGGRTSPVEAIYIKEATNVELAELEIESVLEDKSLSTLLTIEAVRVEQIDESTQIKIQKVAESAVIDTNEKRRPENDLEEEKIVPQAFDLHGVTGNTCTEKKRKDEPQSEVQSLETIIVKHPNVEGKTTDKNPNNDTKELEDIPSSSTKEKLEMNDGGKLIQEEAKEIKEATGVPDKEALPTLLRSAIIKGETVDEIFENRTLKEEESTMIDNGKSCRPENEIEQTAKVVEEINPIETIGKVIAPNEEHADFQPEAPTLGNVVSKHTISAGMLTTERSIESSYDVKKLKKLPESHTVEINFPPEEAIYIKEATNVDLRVPKDEALSTTNTASVRVKMVEECIEEEMREEAESALTDNKEGPKQENNFDEKEKVPEAFYLHEETGNTCAENEKNAELQSDVHSVETMLTMLPNFEVIETKSISPSNHSEELEKISVSHVGQKSEIEEETDMQLQKSKIGTLDASEQTNMHESAKMGKSKLPAEIPEPRYPSKKVESYSDYEAHDLVKQQLPQTKEKSNNIQDQISEYGDHFQGQKFQCENQISPEPEPQLEAKHHFSVPINAKETSASSLITKEVEDEISEKLKASDSSEAQKAITITCLSIENDSTKKEAARRDSDEVIDSTKEDEFEKISQSAGDGTAVVIKGSRDTDVKEAPRKKSHGILSGVGSKVKHSISKVKRAITGKSPHPKTQSPK